jgi:fructose/tagatose bisphosphate aldolase
VVHTDNAAKKWLPWISGLLDAGEAYFKEKKQPLFSSHMLDLSEEPLEENIHTSVEYFKRMKPLGMAIEIELGVTGGEEDGVIHRGFAVALDQCVETNMRTDRSLLNTAALLESMVGLSLLFSSTPHRRVTARRGAGQ